MSRSLKAKSGTEVKVRWPMMTTWPRVSSKKRSTSATYSRPRLPRVHKYSPDGKLLFSWGEPGTDPGQFNLVHNIACDDEGWVYVADRENHRVQVFDGNGKYEAQWHN